MDQTQHPNVYRETDGAQSVIVELLGEPMWQEKLINGGGGGEGGGRKVFNIPLTNIQLGCPYTSPTETRVFFRAFCFGSPIHFDREPTSSNFT